MQDVDEEGALEMVRSMLRWTVRNRLDWEVSPATLILDEIGDITWSVKPKVGGPVVIKHRTLSLHIADIHELVEIATALLDCGKEVKRHSLERAEFEQDMRKAARSLLRRKWADGIRLVNVVCQPIHTDYYQNIGVVVTFAWDNAGHKTETATFEVGDVEDLKAEFNALLDWQENGPSQLAA